MPELEKNSNERWCDVFLKNFAKISIFEVSSLGLAFQVWSLGLGVLDEVSVSKFQPGLGLESYGHNYIIAARASVSTTQNLFPRESHPTILTFYLSKKFYNFESNHIPS